MPGKLVSILSIIVSFGSCSSRAIGQNTNDKLFLLYEISPSVHFKDIRGSSDQTNSFEISLGVPPIKLGSRLKWINNFYGRSTDFQFADLESKYADLPNKLYDVQVGQILIYSFKNIKWSLFAAPRLMIRSDFKEKNWEDGVFTSAIVLANYNPDGKKQFTWSFGLAYANDFSRNQIIPIAGFSYRSKKYLVEVGYPRINILYKPQKRIEWGITSAITGGIFKITDFKVSDDSTVPHVRVISITIGHTLNYLISDHIVVNSCIGYMPVRNYDLLNDEYKEFKSISTDLKPSLFFRTGLSVRF